MCLRVERPGSPCPSWTRGRPVRDDVVRYVCLMKLGPGRPIDNVDDVTAVFASGRGSFVEYMECVDVCKRAADWPSRHRAAELATAEALRGRWIRPPELIEAAQQVVNAILRRATTIEELELCAPDIRQWFVERDNYFRAKPDDQKQTIERFLFRISVDDALLAKDRGSLYRLVLLANAPEPEYRVKLSATLRNPFDRPDLAVEAATRALAKEPENVAALTTRGAARVDIDDLGEAGVDLDAALAIDGESSHALVARSRCHQYCGEASQSLEVAKKALAIDPANRFSLHRAMAAATAAGGREFFEQVRLGLACGSPVTDGPDPYLEVLAIEALVDGGDLDRAEAALVELEAEEWTRRSLPMHKVSKLRREIARQKRRRQGRLDL